MGQWAGNGVAQSRAEAEFPELWDGLELCALSSHAPLAIDWARNRTDSGTPPYTFVIDEKGWMLDPGGGTPVFELPGGVLPSLPFCAFCRYQFNTQGDGQIVEFYEAFNSYFSISYEFDGGGNYLSVRSRNGSPSTIREATILTSQVSLSRPIGIAGQWTSSSQREIWAGGVKATDTTSSSVPSGSGSLRFGRIVDTGNVSDVMFWSRLVPDAVLLRLSLDPTYHPLARRRIVLVSVPEVVGGTTPHYPFGLMLSGPMRRAVT